MKYAAVLAILVTGCGDSGPPQLTLSVPAAWHDAFTDFAALTPDLSLADTGNIEVTDDPAIPAEGYKLEAEGTGWIVHAHDILGAQYGAAAALEHLGYRFRHPEDTLVSGVREDDDGAVHQPQIRVRGIHLHTLHPIEGYFAVWEPGHQDEFRQIVDWVVKNRGNYIQWPALNDILDDARLAEWTANTNELIAIAHARGVRVGLGTELFGAANIQQAFDLIDDNTPVAPQIAARLPKITSLPFDAYDLSFGEFFDADPQAFIDAVNEVARQLHQLTPAEMHALIHVGETQRVTYQGRNMIFYFLIQYADPSIIPDIHSVMYYDLFEDAGGAYQHSDFSEHRQYLLDRMCAKQPAAYHPEDAYWVAFDDSVPQYLPLYVRSRYVDLQHLSVAGCGPLDEHLIFSSGWEWGYWLHDVAALRTSYELPVTFDAAIEDAYAPDLHDAVPAIVELTEIQHQALIDQHLAAYMAGRDAVIDAGRTLDIISQPDRVTFDDLVAMDDAARAQFVSDVMVPLRAYSAALDALTLPGLPDSKWSREITDGFAIDRARAHFIIAVYQATLDHLSGVDSTQSLADANAALADAKTIVDRRGGDLHDTHGDRLTANTPNHTTYGFGYLYMGATLCYWNRELEQVQGILEGGDIVPPACVLN